MKRMNIAIDEELIKKAMKVCRVKSKREAVQLALEQMVKKSSLDSALEQVRGDLHWTGNLNKMRRGRL